MRDSKVIAALLAAGMMFTLAACSNEAAPVSSDVNVISTEAQGNNPQQGAGVEVTVDPNAASTNFAFTYEGVDVIVGTDMNSLVDSLAAVAGEPQYFEAASCAGDGMSKTYTYKGGSFSISTNPSGNSDIISSIMLNDDTVSTAEGICIGSSADDITAAYGEASNSTETTITYEKGSSSIVFVLQDGKVNNIIYNAQF